MDSIRNAASSAMKRLFGVCPTKHWPDEGISARVIDGVKVWVTPYVERTRVLSGKVVRAKSSKHRVVVECPHCGRHLSAGRLRQHVCNRSQRS